MLRRPEILLPPRRRWPWSAIAASVAVHSLLVFGWVGGRRPTLPHRPAQLIILAPPANGPAEVPMPYHIPRAEGREGTGIAGERPSRPALRPRPQSVSVLPAPEPPPPRADTGSTPAARPRPSVGLIGPGLAQGRLWVRPLPLPPRELAGRLRPGHAELVDSAVTAIVQAYLDSIANEPSARGQTLPSWTKEIAGKTFGIDSRNIYIAGLKIPAAVLALLPIRANNVNPDRNRAYNHLMDLRADLEYAAQRSANLDEFKAMIRDLRLRREREREFERNQRTAPPPADTALP